MSDTDKVVQAFQSAGEPISAGKVAEISGLDKKTVEKIMAQLKAEDRIFSPKRCCWTLK